MQSNLHLSSHTHTHVYCTTIHRERNIIFDIICPNIHIDNDSTFLQDSATERLTVYLQQSYHGDFYKVSTMQSATHLSVLRMLACVYILVCVCATV